MRAGLIARMSDEKMIRIDNLRLLMKQNRWNNADAARSLGVSDQYISMLLGGKKNFGEKAARKFEEKAKKPRYWFDRDHGDELDAADAPSSIGTDIGTRTDSEPAKYLPVIQSDGRLIPVITWEKLYMLDAENSDPQLAGAETAPAEGRAGSKTKWVFMPDESMQPRLHQGCRLKIEPGHVARPGNIVIVRNAKGDHFVRLYRLVSGDHYEAQAANEGFGTLDSVRDELEVVGVVVQALIDC